jgi:hypothetical protein
MVYFSFFHSVMSYGLIFWGNSSHADIVIKLQKRVIRIMMGCGYRESCRDLFKELNILPLKSQYIFSLMMFVVKNRDCFVANKECHEINTGQAVNLHLFQVNLTKYRNGVYHSGVKIFNSLPVKLKEISDNPKKFKSMLKEFLYSHSFYSLEEFFNKKKVIKHLLYYYCIVFINCFICN